MGGGLLQAVGRDDFRFAMKASAICVDGEWRDVYKDPITDVGKRSKRGRLALTLDFETVRLEELGERGNLLVSVFRDGRLLRDYGFDEVRNTRVVFSTHRYEGLDKIKVVPKGLIKNKGNKMNNVDLEKVLKICKSKIDNKEDAFAYLERNFSDSLLDKEMNQLENDINQYLFFKEELSGKNKKYWMLICNPLDWGEGEKPFKVNKLLYELDKESWTINKNTDITHKMKKGHKGIIKVSKDNRIEDERCDDEGNIVEKLISGIYGTFEVVEDEDGDCTYEVENGEWFVNIKMINNFYKEDKIIDKEDAIRYLGKDIFFSRPSRDILEKSYVEIIDFQKTL
jgi:hypothetical protein